MKFVYNKNRK